MIRNDNVEDKEKQLIIRLIQNLDDPPHRMLRDKESGLFVINKHLYHHLYMIEYTYVHVHGHMIVP